MSHWSGMGKHLYGLIKDQIIDAHLCENKQTYVCSTETAFIETFVFPRI